MSKTFIAVDRAGSRRLYLGNRLPSWWIRLSLRLHGWTAEPLITFRDRVAGSITERRSDGSYVIKAEGERFEIPAWIAALIEETARVAGLNASESPPNKAGGTPGSRAMPDNRDSRNAISSPGAVIEGISFGSDTNTASPVPPETFTAGDAIESDPEERNR